MGKVSRRWDWEEEAFRYGVGPDVSREELEALIEASASSVSATMHLSGHSGAGDFARWGQRGGSRTLALYGPGWFALLAMRRCKKITAEQLAEVFTPLCKGRSWPPLYYSLGRVVATPAALALLAAVGENPAELLARHQSGDWGEVPPEDARENDFSGKHGFRIISCYAVGRAAERVWIITEADRSSTCILLPGEY
jgi:hypothetical protein